MRKKYESLIFDLGGVLYDIDVQRSITAFHDLGIKHFENIYTLKEQASLIDALEKGEINEMEFVNGINSISNTSLSLNQVKHAWNALLIGLSHESVNLLKILKSKGYNLFLLSNTNIFHYNAIQEEVISNYGLNKLDDLFDKAYYSFISGMRKPEPGFYKEIIYTHHLDPIKTVFIDDNEDNIRGGIEAGIPSVHKTKDITLVDLLKGIDVI
jgi:glucose-1-phosphatase